MFKAARFRSASASLSKMYGASLRRASASRSFARIKALVVKRVTPEYQCRTASLAISA